MCGSQHSDNTVFWNPIRRMFFLHRQEGKVSTSTITGNVISGDTTPLRLETMYFNTTFYPELQFVITKAATFCK